MHLPSIMKLQIVMHLLEMIIEWNEAKCSVLLHQNSVAVVLVADSEADHLVADSEVVVDHLVVVGVMVKIGVGLEEVLGEVIVVEAVSGVVRGGLGEEEDIEVALEVDLEEAVEGEECVILAHGLVELDFNFDFFLITFSYLLPICNIF